MSQAAVSQGSSTTKPALAALAVGIAGVLLYKGLRACRGPNGEARCPVTGAYTPSSSSGGGGCPMSGHGHHGGNKHTQNNDQKGKKKPKRLGDIVPFQPRAFTPEQLALCDGTHPDPLGLLKSASVAETCTFSTSRHAQLEEDLSTTSNMVCISVKGIVFKVTPQFYGEGEPYSVYAGKDITRCLAIGIVGDSEANLPWNAGSAKAFAEYYRESSNATSQNGEIKPPQATSPIINSQKAREAIEEVLAGSPSASYDGEFTAEELKTLDLWSSKYEKKYQIVGWFAPFSVVAETSNNCVVAKGEKPPPLCKTTREVLDYVAAQLDLTPPQASRESTTPSTRRRINAAASSNGELNRSEAPPASVMA